MGTFRFFPLKIPISNIKMATTIWGMGKWRQRYLNNNNKKTMSGVGKRQEETHNKEEHFSRMMRHAAKQPNISTDVVIQVYKS